MVEIKKGIAQHMEWEKNETGPENKREVINK